MRTAVVFSIACGLGVQGDEEASLLQANAGKKRLQSPSAAWWIEELAHVPGNLLVQYAKMEPVAKKNLLQQLASEDVSTLTKVVEQHKEAMALAFRGSKLAQGSTSDWVSALQQTSELEAGLARKNLRAPDDGGEDFPAEFRKNNVQFDRVGGRCRTGQEFADITSSEATTALCAVDAATCGVDKTDEQTCQELCDSNVLCSSFAWDTEEQPPVCKRFTANLATHGAGGDNDPPLSLADCADKCNAVDECAAIEWDNGECELHDSMDVGLSRAEALGADHACFSVYVERKPNDGLQDFSTFFHELNDQFFRIGGRCKTGQEFPDLTFSETFTALCAADAASCAAVQNNEETCQELCNNNELCSSSEWDTEEQKCKRFIDTLATYGTGGRSGSPMKLADCARKCVRNRKQGKGCAAFEWDNGECELHDSSVNAGVSRREGRGAEHACYSVYVEVERTIDDGRNDFPTVFHQMGLEFDLAGGRCRTGQEFADLASSDATAALCAADATTCGVDKTDEQTCQELCASDVLCSSSQWDTEEQPPVCKRFTANLPTPGDGKSPLSLAACAEACASVDGCAAIEWDNGECELHDSTMNVRFSSAEPLGTDHACFSVYVTPEVEVERAPNDTLQDFPILFHEKGVQFDRVGGRCRTGQEFPDLESSNAITELCAANATCGVNKTDEEICQELCDNDELCTSFEWDTEEQPPVCKRFTANLETHGTGGDNDPPLSLADCAGKCVEVDRCEAIEWDNGECELHDSTVNVGLSSVEAIGTDHVCFTVA